MQRIPYCGAAKENDNNENERCLCYSLDIQKIPLSEEECTFPLGV